MHNGMSMRRGSAALARTQVSLTLLAVIRKVLGSVYPHCFTQSTERTTQYVYACITRCMRQVSPPRVQEPVQQHPSPCCTCTGHLPGTHSTCSACSPCPDPHVTLAVCMHITECTSVVHAEHETACAHRMRCSMPPGNTMCCEHMRLSHFLHTV